MIYVYTCCTDAGSLWWDVVENIFSPLIAVFLGAYFAYLWQGKQQINRKKRDEVDICAKIYLTLSNQLNQLALIARDLAENVDTESKEIGVQLFDHRREYVFDNSLISFIAISDGATYMKIHESNEAYSYILSMLRFYNKNFSNHLIAIHTLGRILSAIPNIVEQYELTLESIDIFVKSRYGLNKFVKFELGELNIEKINEAGKIATDFADEHASSLGIRL